MAIYAVEQGTVVLVSAVCVTCTILVSQELTFSLSLTQATDTNNVKIVFAAVKETILQNALKDSGIL